MSKNFKGSPVDPVPLRITNAAASGDTPIVAAVLGKTCRVYGIRLSVAGATIVQVKNGAGTILEVFNFAGAGGGVVLDLREEAYYTTSANTAFIINSSAAVQVDGQLEYSTA